MADTEVDVTREADVDAVCDTVGELGCVPVACTVPARDAVCVADDGDDALVGDAVGVPVDEPRPPRDAVGVSDAVAVAVAVVRELLDRGAEVDASSAGGATALLDALLNGRTGVVLELAARGADVNARIKNGWSALMWACRERRVVTAAELLRLGADVNAQATDGWSALMEAADAGHAVIVCVLLAAPPGVNVNLVRDDRSTALSLARAYDDAAVIARWRRRVRTEAIEPASTVRICCCLAQ